MSNSSIWPIDRTLSATTTLDQSEPRSDGNEGVFCIPQSSSIRGVSPSDCLVSYPGQLLWGGVLPLCKDAVGVFYSSSRLGSLLYEMWSQKHIETEQKWTMNEKLIFFKMVPMTFNLLIQVNFLLVKVALRLFFWYKVASVVFLLIYFMSRNLNSEMNFSF